MAASWREPKCPACRFDFHRIRSGPEKGLGIYTKCWNCEAKDAAIAAQERAAERRRLIVSESERHWLELRRRERGESLAEELGEEGPMPNPVVVTGAGRSSRCPWCHDEVPLDPEALTCLGCKAVSHAECVSENSGYCPACRRSRTFRSANQFLDEGVRRESEQEMLQRAQRTAWKTFGEAFENPRRSSRLYWNRR